MASSSSAWRLGMICSRSQINIDILLNCGQSFRWKRKNEVEWIGVIRDHVWQLRQTGTGILYTVHGDRPMKKQILAGDGSDVKQTNPKIISLKETKCDISKVEASNSNGILSSAKVGIDNDSSNQDIKEFNETTDKNINENCGNRSRRSARKRSSIKVEFEETSDSDYLPIKQIKSENCSQHFVKPNSSNGLCHLPSSLLKDGVMKLEQLKEIYIDEKIQYLDDKVFLHTSEDCEKILEDYFQSHVNLCELYDHWSQKDPHFKEVAAKFEGIRMLRQDPTENLLSFVCSSNNHISRISGMVEKLCVHYGTFITEVDGEKFYSFPTMAALTGDEVEGHLRQLAFGYRAKFIAAIARYITQQQEDGWLESLRDHSTYKEAKLELMKLMGVGAKVADCVCLMSLDKPEALPVDTHVWQITQKNYLAKLQTAKSLTERIYNEIGDFYRDLWGPYAGWAHSVLFTADLKHNKTKETTKDSTQSGNQGAKTKNKGNKTKHDEVCENKETTGKKKLKEKKKSK